MHVTESLNQGLKREYTVVVDAAHMTSRIDARLAELRKSSHIKGFRPGKVPLELFRSMYGDGVVQEVLKSTIEECSNDALSEQKIRQALPATVQSVSFSRGEDLEYVLAVEVMPDIGPLDHSGIVLSTPCVEIGEADVRECVDLLARPFGESIELDDKTGVVLDDLITADVEIVVNGKKDDELSLENHRMVLSDGSLPAKVLEAVTGLTTGNSVEVEDVAPGSDEASATTALFRVSLAKAERMVPHAIDDDLAAHYSCDSLDALREHAHQELAAMFTALSRAYTKRRLLDRLNDTCDFEVPSGLVEREFQSVWNQVGPTLEKQGLDEEAVTREREDYRAISERRVRLGMLVGEVGKDAGIEIAQEDMQEAVVRQARLYPGREAEVVRQFQEQPELLRQLTAPILEDRVIDHILESVTCEEQVMDVTTFVELDSEGDGTGIPDARQHYLNAAQRIFARQREGRNQTDDQTEVHDATSEDEVEDATGEGRAHDAVAEGETDAAVAEGEMHDGDVGNDKVVGGRSS